MLKSYSSKKFIEKKQRREGGSTEKTGSALLVFELQS